MSNDRLARLLRAVHNDDPELARFIASKISAGDLRTMLLELAAKVPAESENSTLHAVLAEAGRPFGVNSQDILSTNRRHEVVKARHVACHAAHLLGYSYSHIGRHIGRDHTSVMNAVSKAGEHPTLRAVAQRVALAHGWDRNAYEEMPA